MHHCIVYEVDQRIHLVGVAIKADSQYDTNAAVNTYKWQVQGGLM